MAKYKFTKAKREAFLESVEKCNENMPREARQNQGLLFEDVIETDNKRKLRKIKLVLKYPPISTNEECNPIPKQSTRFTVRRILENGPNKGDVFTYVNKRTGKLDVITSSYQDSRIVKTEEMLQLQIRKQLSEQRFKKFRGAVFVTRMEFIFKHLKTHPKYIIDDLKTGDTIHFKETRPDLDNLEKLVWDACQIQKMNKDLQTLENDMRDNLRGLVYDDDAQIVSKNGIFKRWGMIPGVIIEIEGYEE